MLAAGRSLAPRFSLVRPFGNGKLGEAWLAQDHELEGAVLVRIVPPDLGADDLALLRRRCRQARRLHHHAIVPVFDFHQGEEHAFLTMGYAEGRDLGSLGRLEPAEALRLGAEIADALTHAHERDVVHGGLCAGNVICDGKGHVHLLDFGLSELLVPAPEPKTHADRQAAEDDAHALGLLLVGLLTGTPAASALDDPALPEPVRQLLARWLAPAPEERPSWLAEVHAELEATRRQLASGDPAPAPSPAPTSARGCAVAGVALAALLGAAALAAVWLWARVF